MRYNRVAVDSINILFGVVWLFGGLIWLRRAMTKQARPSEPASLLAEQEMPTQQKSRWVMWINAGLYVMLGVLYTLKAVFSQRH
jgi:hypothetical protein